MEGTPYKKRKELFGFKGYYVNTFLDRIKVAWMVLNGKIPFVHIPIFNEDVYIKED